MTENFQNKEELPLILFGNQARANILKGVELLSNIVKETLGPRGRNVLMDSEYGTMPTFSKDGVGIARKSIKSILGKFESIGARAVLGASETALRNAGDGTTTAVVLTEVLYKEGIKAVEEGNANPILLKRYLDKLSKYVVDELKKIAIPIGKDLDLYNVAMVSSNFDEEISKTVAEAFNLCGKNVNVTMERSSLGKTYVEKRDGYEIEGCGPIASQFVSVGDSVNWKEEGVRILLVNDTLEPSEKLDEFLNDCFVNKQSKLLILAENFNSQLVIRLAQNVITNGICINLVKLRGTKDVVSETLKDIAAITNTQVFGKNEVNQIDDLKYSMLGVADRVLSRPDYTVISGTKSVADKVKSYADGLSEKLKEGVYATNPVKEERLKDRISKILGGVCNIYINAVSDSEYREMKEHYDDCICSCRCALESGLLPGGGTSFVKVLQKIDEIAKNINSTDKEFTCAVEILKKALKTPLETLLKNCGYEDKTELESMISKVLENKDPLIGFNLNDQEAGLVNLFENGIVDAASVPVNSLISAVSFAGILLSTSVCIALPDDANLINPFKI